jgi:hypothetical protein
LLDRIEADRLELLFRFPRVSVPAPQELLDQKGKHYSLIARSQTLRRYFPGRSPL